MGDEQHNNLRLAIGSLIDIVTELTVALERGLAPGPEWVTLVHDILREHKRQLGFEL